MRLDRKALVELLPAIYRIRDLEQGEPLTRLLSVIAEQLEVLQENVDQLYDDQFIETCAEWVVPYIGALVGARGVRDVRATGFSTRAFVANTIAYRRRKGTASVLEQLARDLSGWNAAVVEFFLRLAWTQNLNHVRLDAPVFVDLRDAEAMERIETPFERAMRTVDVRRIRSGRGKHNIPNIGIFLWRIEAYPLTSSPASRAVPLDELRWRFSPLGNDTPLFSFPRTEEEITHLAERDNVPMPISRRELARSVTQWYGDPGSVFVRLGGVPVAAENVESCNFADVAPSWDHVPAPVNTLSIDPELGRLALPAGAGIVTVWVGGSPEVAAVVASDLRRFTFTPPGTNPFVVKVGGVPVDPSRIRVADTTDLWNPALPENDVLIVDAVKGRLIFPADPAIPRVSWHYGAIADIGGGEYEREASFLNPGEVVVRVPERTIVQALQALGSSSGVIEIDDSGRYEENLQWNLAAAQRVEIRAKNGARPTVILNSDANIGGATDSELTLNGLLIAGKALNVPVGSKLAALRIRHCTLVPGLTLKPDGTPGSPAAPSLTVLAAGSLLAAEIANSFTGRLDIVAEAGTLVIRDSVIDSPDPAQTEPAIGAAAGNAPATTIARSTIFGRVNVKELTLGSESIFTDVVKAERKQAGCVRFSFVLRESSTPRRYRCQPDLAVREGVDERIIRPDFVSRHYGHPAYAQLATGVHRGITTGAEDGSEMGVYSSVEAARREANLRASLDEYLRFGLEAGIFYVS